MMWAAGVAQWPWRQPASTASVEALAGNFLLHPIRVEMDTRYNFIL